MSELTLFYSWQSDRPSKCCRDFIRRAAEAAAVAVGARLGVTITVDSDTAGVPGTPPITDTILEKIRACDIFLGDMTFVAVTEDGKRAPNPNVMGEYGYALHAKGPKHILLAMNTAFGPPDQLPFDLHHLRHPAHYDVPADMPDGERRAAREAFARKLEANVEVVAQHVLRTGGGKLSIASERLARANELIIELQRDDIRGRSPVLVSAPKLVVRVVPIRALDQPELSPAAVRDARTLFPPSFDARMEDGSNVDQWWSSDPPRHIPGLPNPESTWSTRLVRPGVFEFAENIGRRIGDDPQIIVRGWDVEKMLVSAVDRAASIATKVRLGGPALVHASLEGMVDAEIHRSRGQPRRIREHSIGLGAITIPNLVTPSADYLRPIMDRLWLAGGWDDGSPSFNSGHWDGYG